MNLDNSLQPSSISKRSGRYREKGMVYVSLGIRTKSELEKLASIDGVTVSQFIRQAVNKEIGRREERRENKR